MNVGELKAKINDLPDDMVVCGSGWFIEELAVYGADTETVLSLSTGVKTPSFVIDMEYPGPEPDDEP